MTRQSCILPILGLAIFLKADLSKSATPPADLKYTLPAIVRRAYTEEAGDEKLTSVNRTNSIDEPLIFEMETEHDGKTRAMSIASDGKVLEKQLFPGELPVPVRKSIETISKDARLGDIIKTIDDTFTETYTADMSRGGTNRTFTVDDEGELMEMQYFLSELPASVQKCIQAEAAGATIGDITKSYDNEDYDVAYDVEMTKAGKSRAFTVSTNGALLDMQLFLAETPPAVRKAIQAQSGRGRLGDIKKSIEEGETYYSVSVTSARRTIDVTFDSDGEFAAEEEDMVWTALPPAVKRALKPLQGAAAITDVDRTTEGSNTLYEIELREGTKKRYLTFKPNGVLVP